MGKLFFAFARIFTLRENTKLTKLDKETGKDAPPSIRPDWRAIKRGLNYFFKALGKKKGETNHLRNIPSVRNICACAKRKPKGPLCYMKKVPYSTVRQTLASNDLAKNERWVHYCAKMCFPFSRTRVPCFLRLGNAQKKQFTLERMNEENERGRERKSRIGTIYSRRWLRVCCVRATGTHVPAIVSFRQLIKFHVNCFCL